MPILRNITVTVQCIDCAEQLAFKIAEKDYNAFRKGRDLEKAMPYLEAPERLAFIYHVCLMCQPKWLPQPKKKGQKYSLIRNVRQQ